MKDKTYTFIRDGRKYETSNLMAFCREHKLQRRHMNEVVMGLRKSHHGFSAIRTPEDAIGIMTEEEIEQTLASTEIAARSSGDPEYEALVMKRVDMVRRHEPLRIATGKNAQGQDTITMLD